jgi:hypothetical protein
VKNWQPAKKRCCQECGEWYWNAGAHAERCTGRRSLVDELLAERKAEAERENERG